MGMYVLGTYRLLTGYVLGTYKYCVLRITTYTITLNVFKQQIAVFNENVLHFTK